MWMGHRTKDSIPCEMDRTDETVPLRTLQPASTASTVLQIVTDQTGHIVSGERGRGASAYLSQMI